MKFDVGIIGAGPVGTTLAALLQKRGLATAIFEKRTLSTLGKDKIGESLIPATLEIFEEAGSLQQIKEAGFTRKTGGIFRWGSDQPWRFDFSEHPTKQRYSYAFQVERESFDPILFKNAYNTGSECFLETTVENIEKETLHIKKNGRRKAIGCRFIMDCSGVSSVIGRQRRTYDQRFQQIAIFARYKGVKAHSLASKGDIICDATVNGWMWQIPLRNGVTSIGYITRSKELKSIEQELQQAIENAPLLSHTSPIKRISQVRAIANYSYRTEDLVDEHFALVGDAGNFIDPVWSTGIALGIQSAKLLADALPKYLQTQRRKILTEAEKVILNIYDSYRSFVNHFYALEGNQESTFWKAHQLVPDSENRHAAFLSVISGKMRGR